MKRLPLEANQYLNILVKEEKRCFENWVDKCGDEGSKEKYFDAKKKFGNSKKNTEKKGMQYEELFA